MTIYVRSGAPGANNGGSWNDAYISIASALGAAPAAGTVIFVAEDHTESLGSATTLIAGATEAASTNILCVNHTTGALATTAVVATVSTISLTLAGYAYCYGITFAVSSGNNAGNLLYSGSVATDWTFEACALKLVTTSTASYISVGTSNFLPYRMTLINTALSFGQNSQTIRLYGALVIKGNGTTIGGTTPLNLVAPIGYNNMSVTIEGVDLSTYLTSGHYLLGASSTLGVNLLVKDCKLASAPSLSTLVNGGTIAPTTSIDVIRCAIAGTPGNAVRQHYAGEGGQVDSTAVTLTGGTSQDGTTVRSRLITTTASASIGKPFELTTVTLYNANTTVAMTVAFQGILDASAVPNDNDVWAELEYLKDANDPLGQFVSSNLSTLLGSGNPLAAGTGTWNGAGGMTSPKPFMFTTPSFTPAQAGFLTIRLKVGKPSTTLYVDPKPIVTLASGTFPNISRSLDLPTGGMMHETAATVTNTVTQVIPIARMSW